MKKALIRILSITLIAVLLCGLAPMTASAAGNEITGDFTDEKFLARIYVLLDRDDGEPIYDDDVADIEELWVGIRGIESLDGIEHFTNLKILGCYSNELTELPPLPAGLEELYAANNQLTELPVLPCGLTHLSVAGNELAALPVLPNTLEVLWCGGNQLTKLPRLPASLKRLYCERNRLRSINLLGIDLEYINCTYNDMAGVTCIRGFTGMLDLIFAEKEFRFFPQNDGLWAGYDYWVMLILEGILFGWVWMRMLRWLWA